MKTLALKNENWDFFVDSLGNWATKESNDQIAQDVASSCRVFKGEMEFDVGRGVEYREPDKIRKTINDDIRRQALLIEGVKEAVVSIESIDNRRASVIIYVTNENGDKITVGEETNE